MKLNYAKFFLTVALLAMNFAVSAQLPDPNDGDTGGDDPPAPVNTYIIYLGIAAVLFAFFQIRSQMSRSAK